jgi:hypothetical protein
MRGQCVLQDESTLPVISYTTPVTYFTDVPITPNTPESTGGAVASFSIAPGDPALPVGLLLNPITGVISGTPTVPTGLGTYTITATNATGSSIANLDITVDLSPPTNLKYKTPVTYVVGVPITPNIPTVTGTVTTWSINPDLNAQTGLTFSTVNGTISGTPTTAIVATDYTVSASNATPPAATFVVNITVQTTLVPPSNIAYASPVSYKTYHVVNPANVPTFTGIADSWAIAPDLAAATGLTFDTTTGTISGMPTIVTTASNYSVTATNASGTSNPATIVNIATPLGEPRDLEYSPNYFTVYIGQAMIPQAPSQVFGGGTLTYTSSPSLAGIGLTINSSNGTISGTPNGVASNAKYTIRVTNAAGFDEYDVSITSY